eukprot:362866-Chlamydomonas_euryale.AAC.42
MCAVSRIGRAWRAAGRHLAVENFHYSARRLGLPPNASLAELADAGTAFCARPWADVERELVDGTSASQLEGRCTHQAHSARFDGSGRIHICRDWRMSVCLVLQHGAQSLGCALAGTL